MSSFPIVAGMSNQWLRDALKRIAQEHAAEAKKSPATAAALKLTETRIEQVSYVPSVDTSGAVELLLEAAKQHGEDSEPDHEVGDLQDILRAVWKVLTPYQRAQVLRSSEISQVLEGAAQEPLASTVEDAHDWEQVCEFYGLDASFQYGDEQVLEYTNMYRLDALRPADLRYVHGTWEDTFHPGRGAATVRLVYDRQQAELVAMEVRDRGGWVMAFSEEIRDVEDSLKNANPEAIDNPEVFGLEASDSRPHWCAEEVRRLSEREGS